MITSKRFDGKPCVLLYEDSRQVVARYDEVTLRDGAVVSVEGGSAPHKPSSTGRVGVRYEGGSFREYFPSVAGMFWHPYICDECYEPDVGCAEYAYEYDHSTGDALVARRVTVVLCDNCRDEFYHDLEELD